MRMFCAGVWKWRFLFENTLMWIGSLTEVNFFIFIDFQVKAVYLTWNRMTGRELCKCTITSKSDYFFFCFSTHFIVIKCEVHGMLACLSPTTMQVFHDHHFISYQLYIYLTFKLIRDFHFESATSWHTLGDRIHNIMEAELALGRKFV
jgi:hypothetical protein